MSDADRNRTSRFEIRAKTVREYLTVDNEFDRAAMRLYRRTAALPATLLVVIAGIRMWKNRHEGAIVVIEPLIGIAVALVITAVAVVLLTSRRIVVDDSSLTHRTLLRRRRLDLSALTTAHRCVVMMPAAFTAQLQRTTFLTDADGRVVLRLTDAQWRADDIDRLLARLAVTTEIVDVNLTQKQARSRFPGAYSWAGTHPVATAVATTVVIVIVLVAVVAALSSSGGASGAEKFRATVTYQGQTMAMSRVSGGASGEGFEHLTDRQLDALIGLINVLSGEPGYRCTLSDAAPGGGCERDVSERFRTRARDVAAHGQTELALCRCRPATTRELVVRDISLDAAAAVVRLDARDDAATYPVVVHLVPAPHAPDVAFIVDDVQCGAGPHASVYADPGFRACVDLTPAR